MPMNKKNKNKNKKNSKIVHNPITYNFTKKYIYFYYGFFWILLLIFVFSR